MPKQINPLAPINDFMEARRSQLTRALPKHIPAERFIRVFLNAMQGNPDLIAVDRQSLWNACMKAAQDGLLPDGREGAIVPFGKTAQWMPMVGGLLKRFRNSGQFKSIAANIVREGEEFTYWIDENGEHMKHVPGDGTGKPIKAYALAVTQNDGTMIRVMTAAEIKKRQNMSRAKNSPLWNEWADEAWMKTVLRNLHKRLPSSSDLDDLVRRDDALYEFDTKENNPTPEPITTVGDALDSFGGNPTPEDLPPGGEERHGAANNDDDGGKSNGEVGTAYARGAKARRDGLNRRAVPPEYREPEASHLAKSWWSGWDSVSKE